MAKKYYGPLEPTKDLPVRTRPQEPPQLAERRLIFEDARVAQPYVIRTYQAPERDAGDQENAAALTMLAQVLGGSSATSVLGRALQVDTQKAVYASAFYSGVSYDDTSFGLIMVPTPGMSLQQAEDELDAVVAKFIEDGVDEEQLKRVKTQVRASQIYAEDDVAGVARQYGAALTSGLTVEDVQAWPGLLDAVTGEQIVEAAKMVLDRRKAVTGWFRKPTKSEVTQ